jgi:hypothetical protein
LLDGEFSYCDIAEPVEAIRCGDPHIAFSIFEETADRFAGKTIGPGKLIRFTVVETQQPSVRSSNPQVAFTIPQNLDCSNRLPVER